MLLTHPGEEAYYVVDGATCETPDGKPVLFDTGIGRINVRDVPHGAFKIAGDTLKLLTVHIVDKGKPMFAGKVTRPSCYCDRRTFKRMARLLAGPGSYMHSPRFSCDARGST